MRTSKFTESQIIATLEQANGWITGELTRQNLLAITCRYGKKRVFTCKSEDTEVANEVSRIKYLFDRLIMAKRIPFPMERKSLEAPDDAHGVYIIRSPRGKVLHVGRTVRGKKCLRQRLYNHLYAGSSFTNKYLDGNGGKLRGKYTYAYLVVPDISNSDIGNRRRALLEALAVGSLCPAHMGLGRNLASE